MKIHFSVRLWFRFNPLVVAIFARTYAISPGRPSGRRHVPHLGGDAREAIQHIVDLPDRQIDLFIEWCILPS